MKHNKRILSVLLSFALLLSVFSPASSLMTASAASTVTKAENAQDGFKNYIKNTANQFIVIRHKQLGNSHYAYTASVSDAMGFDQPTGDNEYTFFPGSEMVLLTYNEDDVTVKSETRLLRKSSGIIRDPDVSADGTKVLFSMKQSATDDFHIYEMDIATKEYTQLTFGQGIADTEPRYLPNGKILFSSTRIIQTVDCWKTQVSNLYTCDADGKNILRLGYDQVHTTYPTITSDGRILYTRWDYNDRNQMFVQGVFQMFPDGTNQTELFGNNSSFPTTLLHTSEIPGQSGKYYSIASGHHTYQCGKLCVVDTNIDRNEYREEIENPEGKTFATTLIDAQNSGARPLEDSYNYDKYGQTGWVYKFPIGISENELLVSMTKNPGGGDGYINRSADFGIYYTFIKEDGTCEYIEMAKYSSALSAGASQICPIPKTGTEKELFERPSMVNYGNNTGTYYVGSVYEGEAVKNLTKPTYDENGNVTAPGEVAQLRVVALDYRHSSIGYTGQGNSTGGLDGGWGNPYTPISTGNGSWDVKQVLGVVDVEADGSALFSAPSETPVYFQLLNDKGQVLQTMRSWSTLMPGESFSCVGCHENKNSVPPAASSTTLAMQKGVQQLKNEDWMNKETSGYTEDYDPYTEPVGFSYMKEVQTIFDKNCVSCHNNTSTTATEISYTLEDTVDIIAEREEWSYKTSESANYKKDYAPFGTLGTAPNALNTVVNEDTLYLEKEFNVTTYQKETYDFKLLTTITGDAEIKLNGKTLDASTSDISINKADLVDMKDGTNTITVKVSKATAGMYFDVNLVAGDFTSPSWYATDYDDSSWRVSTSGGGFGGDWGATKYSSNDLFARYTFDADANQVGDNLTNFSMNIKYDENPKVYVNGRLLWEATGWFDTGYTNIDLTSAAKPYLVEGDNVFAITVTNGAGGKGLDLDLNLNGTTVINRGSTNWKYSDGQPPKAASRTDLLPKKSQWKYTTSNPGENWYNEDFNDSSWTQGTALFGNDNTCATRWSTSNLWIRTTFNIEDETHLNEVKTGKIKLDAFFDENPVIYVNGTEVLRQEGYNGGYQTFDLTEELGDALKVGTNTVAASAINTTGGQFLDVSIRSIPKSDIPVSLEGTLVDNGTTQRRFPMSYFLLTGSTSAGECLGKPNAFPDGPEDNGFTTWVSSMSGSGIQQAKLHGSIASPIIDRLYDDHKGLLSSGKITQTDIEAIQAWIDLCVPLCGSYDELNLWGGQATREFEEKQNKFDYYDDMNTYSRQVRAGKVENNGELTMSYVSGTKTLAEKTGSGIVELNVAAELKVGDVVTIKLPKGKKFVAYRLDPRFEEAIVYCPSGTFSYVVPADVTQAFPRVLQPDEGNRFRNLTMAARIPSDNELKTQSRNLALNPYDVTNSVQFYPHVTTSSNYDNNPDFCGRNAIDGFSTNQGHGSFPYHSWGPNQGNNEWFNINFGRNVAVDKVVVYTRADFPHDTHYVSGTLEFSDGTEKDVSFYKTKDGIEFDLVEPIETTFVKLKNLTAAVQGWAGFAEVEVYGVEKFKSDDEIVNPVTKVTIAGDATINLNRGETKALSATVEPANADEKTIFWTSDDPTVATVDTNGVITATGGGTTKITAISHNDITATVTVNVKSLVSSVSIGPKYNVGKAVGDTVQLIAAVKPDDATNQKLKWESDNPIVASVDENGLVTCLNKGTAKIYATSTDGSNIKSSYAEVRVTTGTGTLVSVTIDPSSATLTAGTTKQLTTVFAPAAMAEDVTWKSSNTAVATVDNNGLVKAVKAGTATITVTSKSGKVGTATITVKGTTATVKVSKVTVKATSVAVGASKALKVTVNPSNASNKGVTFKSSNNKVATVNASGKVTGKKVGKVTITVTAKDGSKVVGKCTVTVKPNKVTKLKVTGAKKKLTVTFKKGKGSNMTKIVLYKGSKKVNSVTTSKTKYTFKKLKKASYKVKVTAYKKVSKKTYSSTTVTSKKANVK